MRTGFLILCLGAAACGPRPRPRPLAVKTPVEESRKRVAREYFEAVDAYMKADYGRARAFIGSILFLDPGNPDALALRRRVKAVEKLSAQ